MDDFWGRIEAFFVGLLWRVPAGMIAAFTLLTFDLTKYSQYDIDWWPILVLMAQGIGREAVAFYQEHKALLALPESVRLKLEQAERANIELRDTRAVTAGLKVVAELAPPEVLREAVRAMHAPDVSIASTGDQVKVTIEDKK